MKRLLCPLTTVVLVTLATDASKGQSITRDQYLRFLPLAQPRIVAQTPANARFQLFGDRSDPAYRDVEPRDGIDDRRGGWLNALALRFAPYLVRNTTAVPMDFKRFMDTQAVFPLFIDTWDITLPGGRLLRSRMIDMAALQEGSADDVALLKLLRGLGPSTRVVDPVSTPYVDSLQVLYFDFPGEDPASWKREYENVVSGELPRAYQGFARIYAHPFIHQVRSGPGGIGGYELVLQYWFFYPFNDGGNDHEGDWEHINVVTTFRGDDDGLMSEEQLRVLLRDDQDSTYPLLDQLVISRVEYYFHSKVMILDYLSPNVYRARDEWRREVEERVEERLGERWMWRRIRELAYTGRDEQRINTHPVGYIGADNKGTDQLLHWPGGTNRDSHGTYPLPGLYKDVGPASAAEQINADLNYHYAVYDPDAAEDPRLERFDVPERIELVPDWEVVSASIRSDAEVRREWSWLVLPIRWGFPASRSPFAGVVAHAETGNLAPVGPAYNSGWNRVGARGQYELYDPHKFGGTLPLGWQDSFVNSWGFLNLTLPTLVVLPPFDFAWRVVLAPARLPFQSGQPTFYPREGIPFRLFGVGGGVSVAFMSDDFSLLFTAPALLNALEEFIAETDTLSIVQSERTENAVGAFAQVNFYVGRRFVSENQFRRITADAGFDIRQPALGRSVPVRGQLELWEYSGSLRYNLSAGTIQPFVKAGYGLSWYRLTGTSLDGEPLGPGRTDWVRQPSLLPPENLLPNTWHVGGGLEIVPVSNFGAFPRGIDVGLRTSFAVYFHSLGLGRPEILSDQEDVTLTRGHFNLGVAVSF